MSKNALFVLCLSVFLMSGLTTARAAEDDKMAGMPPEYMEKMKEYMTANEHHKVLESLVGEWTTSGKFWMDPSGEPEVSSGTSSSKMIMNGKFLEQTFNGTVHGQAFEGRGIMGYDNMKKEYVSIWFDSMGTGIMKGTASYDPATKTFTEKGSMTCPISENNERNYRSVITVKDPNTYTFDYYMTDKDGKEFKSMEITYTRK